jgi:uncharacterized membrane protein YeaQ/YmgE (transglycosylase-associated protein family)
MEIQLPLLLPLLAGAVGGNIAGATIKHISLGLIGNSLTGLLGGSLGSQLLSLLSEGGNALSGPVSILIGGTSGAVLTLVFAALKKAFSK